MWRIRQVSEPDQKRAIARKILEALPDWFEITEAREAYIRESAEQIFFAAFTDEEAIGFLCLKETGNATVELAVMGVLKEYHRHGVGRALFAEAKKHATRKGYSFLQVKTVQMGCYADYDDTNRFYLSLGFQELEVIPAVWGEENPCQIYVMTLQERKKILELMLERYSYRGKYKPDPVPKEDLTAIMEAGLAAPSGCNQQTTSLIAVDDPAVLDEIHKVLAPSFAETAPALICVLTKRIISYHGRCFATQDYSAAIENMLIAIIALGYQSCWYEGYVTDTNKVGEKIARLLGVPEEYELICILPVGIAETASKGPAKLPFEERAWFNGFHKDSF